MGAGMRRTARGPSGVLREATSADPAPHNLLFVGIRRDQVEAAVGHASSTAADVGGTFFILPEPPEKGRVSFRPFRVPSLGESLVDLVWVRAILPGSTHVEPNTQGQDPSEDLQEKQGITSTKDRPRGDRRREP